MSQCPRKIDHLKQSRHVAGHPNYERGLSILRVRATTLLPLVGTGQALGSESPGEPGYRERIDFGRVIGKHVERRTRVKSPTTKGIVHYANSGLHIVPCRP